MSEAFSRTRMLFGDEAMDKLSRCRVAVFGIGGVGGYAVEVLARSGVGAIDLVDSDRVSLTNLNRQLIALHSTIGKYKVEVAEARIHDINSQCRVTCHKMFFLPENADAIDLSAYDYVLDCIDTVAAKLELIRRCHALGVPILSCMGAANKMDATAFRVASIEETSVDPLAKVIRKKLRKEGISGIRVVYSQEEPSNTFAESDPVPPPDTAPGAEEPPRQQKCHGIPASNAFVPAAAGIVAGSEIVKQLISN